MEYFLQQLINGVSLGSIYGLIAIGYTMVYGIIGMINFAHGDIFMISTMISLVALVVLMTLGVASVPLILLVILVLSVVLTGLYGWTVERVAYRPLRGSFRLAPLISAIGMSIVLQNYVQNAQGADKKAFTSLIPGGIEFFQDAAFSVWLQYSQIAVMVMTVVVLVIFTYVVTKTPLGRAQRACEQDIKMASLLGIDVDRTISLTFVMGAALAAVAGLMHLLYYGSTDFYAGFVVGIKAFTAAVLGGIGSLPGAVLGGITIGLIETFFAGYVSVDYKDVAAFSILAVVLIFLPTGLLGRPEVEKVSRMSAVEPVEQPSPSEAVDPPPLKQPHPAVALIRDAAIWALITLALTIPIIGLKTVPGGGRYVFQQRWGAVLALTAIVFFGRIILNLTIWRDTRGATARAASGTVLDTPAARAVRKLLVPLMVLVAVTYPFLAVWTTGGLVTGRYWIDLGILVMTYVLLGWGLNIVVGLAGLLDLGYVAFYAVGAYSFALLTMNFGMSFWVCLPIAGLAAAAFGVVLGFPVLRLRGDYLAIVTLAFGEIIRLVLINWREFTGGASGINQIPRPSFFGLEFVASGPNSFSQFVGIPFSPVHRLIFFYYVILALACLVLVVTIRLRRLPIGRAWEALREDEIACRSLGISVVNTKLTAFALGAMFGGFAGTVFAARQGYISPSDFSFIQSALIVAIVVLGGLGSNLGVVFSSLVLIGGIEMLRNLSFIKDVFGPGFDPVQYRMLIFGLVMVVIMVWKPRGLVSSRSPTIALREKKTVSADMISEGHG